MDRGAIQTDTKYRAFQTKQAPHEEIKSLKLFPTKCVSIIHLYVLVLLVLHQMQIDLNTEFLRYFQFSDDSVSYCLVTCKCLCH